MKQKIDYSLRTKTIIKWYEYKMTYPEDEPEEDIPDAEEVQKSLEELSDDEIDLAQAGLEEDQQALVADILERFKEAKQNSVDDLFANAARDEQNAGQMSEEDLIAAICAPKQNNVDALVSEAYAGI